MTLDQLINFIITGATFHLAIKVVAALFMLLHVALAIVILRQTQLMTQMVEADISPVLKGISFVHLLLSVFTLLSVLFLL
jgi:hypothetical protein